LTIAASIYDNDRVQGLVKPVLQEFGTHCQNVVDDVEEQVDVVWHYDGKLESETDQLERVQHAPHKLHRK
jgi:hypothetical protein